MHVNDAVYSVVVQGHVVYLVDNLITVIMKNLMIF